MKFSAPTAASLRNSSLRSSGTRFRRSSKLIKGFAFLSRSIVCPENALRPLTYFNPKRRTSRRGATGTGRNGEGGTRGHGDTETRRFHSPCRSHDNPLSDRRVPTPAHRPLPASPRLRVPVSPRPRSVMLLLDGDRHRIRRAAIHPQVDCDFAAAVQAARQFSVDLVKPGEIVLRPGV